MIELPELNAGLIRLLYLSQHSCAAQRFFYLCAFVKFLPHFDVFVVPKALLVYYRLSLLDTFPNRQPSKQVHPFSCIMLWIASDSERFSNLSLFKAQIFVSSHFWIVLCSRRFLSLCFAPFLSICRRSSLSTKTNRQSSMINRSPYQKI